MFIPDEFVFTVLTSLDFFFLWVLLFLSLLFCINHMFYLYMTVVFIHAQFVCKVYVYLLINKCKKVTVGTFNIFFAYKFDNIYYTKTQQKLDKNGENEINFIM